MLERRNRPALHLCGLVLAGTLAAMPAGAEEGNILSNLFKYGGTTVPPSQPKDVGPAYCPPVEVAEGGAALRTLAGANVRSQISLGRLARECARREDGSTTVRVGVDARVLLGPAGAPGRFEVPVTVTILHDDKVVASRLERTTATIEPGEAQAFATIVTDDIPVPAALSEDYEIRVALGAKGGAKGGANARAGAKPANRRAKPAVAADPAGGGDAGR